ncbi:hypothetical protein BDZ89DRAFT_1042554 [Hymenopellis radicata]|nr:hypothetical protein BDZ89DRAFT_1042554 [Hymenopellis radicata]
MHVDWPRAIARGWSAGMNSQADLEQDSVGWLLNLHLVLTVATRTTGHVSIMGMFGSGPKFDHFRLPLTTTVHQTIHHHHLHCEGKYSSGAVHDEDNTTTTRASQQAPEYQDNRRHQYWDKDEDTSTETGTSTTRYTTLTAYLKAEPSTSGLYVAHYHLHAMLQVRLPDEDERDSANYRAQTQALAHRNEHNHASMGTSDDASTGTSDDANIGTSDDTSKHWDQRHIFIAERLQALGPATTPVPGWARQHQYQDEPDKASTGTSAMTPQGRVPNKDIPTEDDTSSRTRMIELPNQQDDDKHLVKPNSVHVHFDKPDGSTQTSTTTST